MLLQKRLQLEQVTPKKDCEHVQKNNNGCEKLREALRRERDSHVSWLS